jgi:predicted restriction endonuclease
LVAYGRRCAVTGYDAEAALEAAHITPYCGAKSSHVSNGLLLRGDIHTLFDLDLVGIDPTSFTIVVAPPLQKSKYVELHGKNVSLPGNPADQPSAFALNERWKRFREQWPSPTGPRPA